MCLDANPPNITSCIGPSLTEEITEEDEERMIVMEETFVRNIHYLVDGNVAETVFSPAYINISAADINTVRDIVMTVTDVNDNTDSCVFQYNILGKYIDRSLMK